MKSSNSELEYIRDNRIKLVFNLVEVTLPIIKLNLSDVAISLFEIKIISHYIRNNNIISRLTLNNCNLNKNHIKYLREGLEINNTLTFLGLNRNKIGAQGIKFLTDSIINNIKNLINTIDIYDNNIRNEGVRHFIRLLKINRQVRVLFLNSNDIQLHYILLISSLLMRN